jgi:hypothetical protein
MALVECLPSKCEALSSSPNTTKKKKKNSICLEYLHLFQFSAKMLLVYLATQCLVCVRSVLNISSNEC